MLDGVIDLVPAHTTADAFRAPEQDALAIDLIISTIAFDDSRMVELQAVKRDPAMNHIPFYPTTWSTACAWSANNAKRLISLMWQSCRGMRHRASLGPP